MQALMGGDEIYHYHTKVMSLYASQLPTTTSMQCATVHTNSNVHEKKSPIVVDDERSQNWRVPRLAPRLRVLVQERLPLPGHGHSLHSGRQVHQS